MKNNKKITSKWWLEMAKKAKYKADNYAWQTYYYEVAQYCYERFLDCKY